MLVEKDASFNNGRTLRSAVVVVSAIFYNPMTSQDAGLEGLPHLAFIDSHIYAPPTSPLLAHDHMLFFPAHHLSLSVIISPSILKDWVGS